MHSAGSTSHFLRTLEGIVIDARDRFHDRRPWSGTGSEPRSVAFSFSSSRRAGSILDSFWSITRGTGRMLRKIMTPSMRVPMIEASARSDRYPFFGGSAILVRERITLVTYIHRRHTRFLNNQRTGHIWFTRTKMIICPIKTYTKTLLHNGKRMRCRLISRRKSLNY